MASVLATSEAVLNHVVGDLRVTKTLVTPANPYATGGGDALTAAQLGLNQIIFAIAQVDTPGASVVSASYDVANSKLKLNTVSAEVGAVDASAVRVKVFAFGY